MENFKRECPHTDLAVERMRADTETPGAEYGEEEREGCRIARLRITTRAAAESIGRPEGTYITMSFPPLFALDEGALTPLAEQLSRLMQEMCEGLTLHSVLVVGLGNRYMTADAVGPESIRHIVATRHLRAEDPALFAKFADVEISLLSPGVMAQTGIEAQAIVAAAVGALSPDLVIAVDALAARSVTRLATTVQLSDTGIRPGSGVGNARRALDRESLGVPVLAVGIPSVVDTRTLVLDAYREAGLADGDMPEALLRVLNEGESYFVSPRHADTLTERAARLVADAVNMTFSPGFFGGE